MQQVRSFYWRGQVKSRANLWVRRHLKRSGSAWHEFAIGNAGDIFVRNLIQHFYGTAETLNCEDGPRILCVGSIAHRLAPGDILSGVGCKSDTFPAIASDQILIQGLRGPLTERAVRNAGYDLSDLKWHGDPGLLISEMLDPEPARPNNVIFIPHYRERQSARKILPKGMQLVDIDDDPLEIGRKIMQAELVYSSSLHGIVFAHALGRPVVMVRPATEEPLFKFQDYFNGVGLDLPDPLSSITEARPGAAPNSPAHLSVSAKDIVFPAADLLRARGILTG